MYNSNELPKRRKIEPDEFADLLCSGEMVMIREPDLDKHPKHRIYRYSPKDIFVYQPKVNNYPTSISYDTCFQGFTDRFVQKIRSSVRSKIYSIRDLCPIRPECITVSGSPHVCSTTNKKTRN